MISTLGSWVRCASDTGWLMWLDGSEIVASDYGAHATTFVEEALAGKVPGLTKQDAAKVLELEAAVEEDPDDWAERVNAVMSRYAVRAGIQEDEVSVLVPQGHKREGIELVESLIAKGLIDYTDGLIMEQVSGNTYKNLCRGTVADLLAKG